MKRAKEANRNEFGRKKRKSNNSEAMKIRHEKRKEKEDKNLSGNLRFYVSSENEKSGNFRHNRQGKTFAE